MKIYPEIIQNHAQMEKWRQDLHANPEIAYQENQTADYIEGVLASLDVTIHPRMAGTGIIASISNGDGSHGDGSNGNSSKVVGLRADIDALPIDEQTGLSYCSKNQGIMHACGHDGHTVMLLGAVQYLASTKNFNGTVYFIFQPAEEVEGGGEKMVQEGLFKKYPMDAIFGMHNWPGLEAGTIAIKSGPVMAAFDVFDIIIHGKGGHAAKPHLVKDPIVIAAQLISAIQSICSRETDPLHSVVVSITQIHAGENYNVIPQTVHMKGTVRSFSADVQASTEKSLQRMVDGICLANGVKGELNYQKKYPATINHDKETEFARQVAAEVVGKERLVLDKDPSMGSEDFSFMLNQCPGSYVWIGNGDGAALHNPNYNFNDNILSTGASYWVHLVEKYLKNSPAF